jgi:hypothetical protein
MRLQTRTSGIQLQNRKATAACCQHACNACKVQQMPLLLRTVLLLPSTHAVPCSQIRCRNPGNDVNSRRSRYCMRAGPHQQHSSMRPAARHNGLAWHVATHLRQSKRKSSLSLQRTFASLCIGAASTVSTNVLPANSRAKAQSAQTHDTFV